MYTDAAKNSMINSLVGKAAAVVVDGASLHTADPSTTGANEVTGGGYARVAVGEADWAVANGVATLQNDKTFAGPASSGATHFGLWDAGVFVGGGSTSGDQTFNAAGELVLKAGTTIDLNA